MRIAILGVDGYIGWALAQYLAHKGHTIIGLDNLNRRKWVSQIGGMSVVPIEGFDERRQAFFDYHSSEDHMLEFCDITQTGELYCLLQAGNPECIVNLAQMPSAPYSMQDAREAVETHCNNCAGTLNTLFLARDLGNVPIVQVGCFDDQTDVLTDRGWIRFSELQLTDKVCTLDQETEEIKYDHPTQIIDKAYSGPMVHFFNNRMDCLVTPEHRVVLKDEDSGGIYIKRAYDISETRMRIPRGGKWKGEEKRTFTLPAARVRWLFGRYVTKPERQFPMDLWLQLLGLYLSDGCVRYRKGEKSEVSEPTAIYLQFSKDRKNQFARDILNGLELNFTESRTRHGMTNIEVADNHIAGWFAKLGKAKEKFVPREFLELSSRQLEILYQAFIEGDGNRCEYLDRFDSTSIALLDAVQELAMKTGRSVTYGHYKNEDREDRYLSCSFSNDVLVLKKDISEVEYLGRVYCCTVPSGIVMVRRNGRTFWSGNSMGEHGTPNFRIPEGYISYSDEEGRSDDRCISPRRPSSFYHSAKVAATYDSEAACRWWGSRVTDIMQGVVYGVDFPGRMECIAGNTRKDVDEMFGTCLDRFIAQALIGHPLTIYGRGGQTRGYLPLRDSLRCIELLIESPPAEGEYRTVNQFADQYSVSELADLVWETSGGIAEIMHYPNPRVEDETHFYDPVCELLYSLGYEGCGCIKEEIAITWSTMDPDRIRAVEGLLAPRTTWRSE